MLRVWISIWILATVAGVHSVQIISQVKQVVEFNGLLQGNMTISGQCTGFDWATPSNFSFSILGDDGTTHQQIIQCVPPERQYLVDYYGTLVNDGEYFESEICTVTSTQKYLELNDSVELPPVNYPTGQRTLLSTKDDDAATDGQFVPYSSSMLYDHRLRASIESDQQPLNEDTDPMGRSILNIGSSGILAGIQSVVCSGSYVGFIPGASLVAGLIAGASGGCDSNGIDPAALNALQNSITNVNATLNAYLKAQGQVNQDVSDEFAALLNVTKAQDAINQNVQNEIAQTQRNQQITTDTINFMGQQLTSGLTTLNNQFIGLSTQTSNLASTLAALASASQNDTNRLASQIAQTQTNTNQQVGALAAVVANNQQVALAQVRATQQNLVGIAAAVKMMFLDTQMQRAQNAQIQKKITAQKTAPSRFGNTLTIFSEDPGTPPAPNPYNLGTGANDVIAATHVFRYVVGSGTTAIAYQTTWVKHCLPYYLVGKGFTQMAWTDIAMTLGPNQCDTTYSDTNNACNCYFTISQDAKCSLPSSGGVVSPTAYSTWKNSITIDATSCSGGGISSTFSGALQNTNVFSLSNYTAYQAIIAARGATYPNTPIQLITYAPLQNVEYSEILYNPLVLSPSNFTYLMNPTNASDLLNVHYAFFEHDVNAMQIVNDNLDFYANKIYGGLPNFLDQKVILFRRFEQGATGRCTQYAMMSFSNYFLTVSIPTLNQIVVNVESWLDGVPNPVSTVTLQNPFASLAPTDQAFIWDPMQPTKIWNTPPSDVTIAPLPRKRCGDLLYNIVANQTQFTRDQWSAINGQDYEHGCGGNVATYWEADIDPVTGLCTTAAIVPGGGYCTMRSFFTVEYFGVFNDPNVAGNMVIGDKTQGIVTFTMYVPTGEIKLTIGSACPGVAKPTVGSGNQKIVTISNPLQTLNVIQVVQVGSCPQTTILRLNPGASVDFPIYACSRGTGETLTFGYLVNGTINNFQNCSTTVDATVNAATLGSYTGPVAGNFSEQLRTFTHDTALAAVQNVMNMGITLQMQNYQQSIASQMAVAKITGIPVDPVVFVNYTNLVAQAHAVANATNQLTIDASNHAQDYNISNLLVPFLALANQGQQNLSIVVNATYLSIQQYEALNNELAAIKAQADLDIAAAAAAAKNFSAAWNEFGQALINALSPLVTSGNGINFGDIGDVLGKLGTALAKLPSSAVDAAISALTALGGGVSGVLGGLFGSSLGSLTSGIVIIVIIIVFICCLITVLPMCIKPGMPLGGATAAATAASVLTKGHRYQKMTQSERDSYLMEIKALVEKLQADSDRRASRGKRFDNDDDSIELQHLT